MIPGQISDVLLSLLGWRDRPGRQEVELIVVLRLMMVERLEMDLGENSPMFSFYTMSLLIKGNSNKRH